MTIALLGGLLTCAGSATAGSASPCSDAPAALPTDISAQAATKPTFPTFCSIPAALKNVRTAAAFKAAVVQTRLAGAGLVRRTAPDTFTLGGTREFQARAEQEAAAPAPMPTPGGPDTQSFIEAARARAAPPERPK